MPTTSRHTEYVVVPRARAREVRTARGPRDATAHLLDGEMLHFPDHRNHFNPTLFLRRHGLVIRTRRDADGGTYWWAEKPEGEPTDD